MPASYPTHPHFRHATRRNICHFPHLVDNGIGYTLITMADVDIHQTGRKIDISLAIIIIQVDPFGIFYRYRRHPFCLLQLKSVILVVLYDLC